MKTSRRGRSADVYELPSTFGARFDKRWSWPSDAPGTYDLPVMRNGDTSETRRAVPGPLTTRVIPLGAFLIGTWLGLPPRAGAEGSHEDRSPARFELSLPASPEVESSLEQTSVPWPRMNPEARTDRAWLLADGPERRPGTPGLVTLTFDDGPFPETTPYVLRALKKYDVRATFFLIGKYLAGTDERCVKSRQTALEIVRDGHLIGNHSYDHARLGGLEEEAALDEIDRSARAIARTFGEAPRLFRPPYGSLTESLEHALAERKQELVLWNIEVGDMQRDDPDAMFEELRSQIVYNKGGIILLHDIRWGTVRTLPKLLEWLKIHAFDASRPERGGYEVVDLPEYLRRTAADPPTAKDRTELEKARAQSWKRAEAEERRTHRRSAPPLEPAGEEG